MNTIFNGETTLNDTVYDYSGVWVRGGGKIAWRAVVRSTDVVCRPSGNFGDEVSDSDARAVVRELVKLSVEDALAQRAAAS